MRRARSVSGAFLVSLGATFTGRGYETVEAEVRAGSSSGRAFKRMLNPLSTFISIIRTLCPRTGT